VGEGPQGSLETPAECKNPFGIHDKQYSSFTKLVGVSAWILRFINKLKKEKSFPGPLTTTELSEARLLWIKGIQNQNCREVKMLLQKKRGITWLTN
jgi:hypothetical protein